MIIQLLPDQIPRYWDEIKLGLEESAPPILKHDQERYNNILMSLLTGRMQCWVSVDTSKEPHEIKGVLTTTVVTDGCSGTRMLLLYSGYSTGKVEHSFWEEGMEAFTKFAKAKECKFIGTYSDVPYMKDKVKQLGAHIETFGYWIVED